MADPAQEMADGCGVVASVCFALIFGLLIGLLLGSGLNKPIKEPPAIRTECFRGHEVLIQNIDNKVLKITKEPCHGR